MKYEYNGIPVKNIPPKVREYVVARLVDGEYWFYGSYGTAGRARQVADEVGGTLIYASGISF